MYFTGFADEAGSSLDLQIKATKELGWKNIETRNLYGKNLALIAEEQFEETRRKISETGIKFNCFGSGIGNWAKPITEPPDSSYEEMRKAVPRMQKLGIRLIRIMSFAVPENLYEKDFCKEVLKRVKVIVKMAEDAGITCVHENCKSWGGLSFEHTLRLLEGVNSPNFKLVFDTGNPVCDEDVRGKPPYKRQNSWEFYNAVREHVVYVHIKDARMEDGKPVFTFPGEGDGDVKKIVRDLLKRGYNGGFSIEPHMVSVYHDKISDRDDLMFKNYVEYGHKFMKLMEEIKN